MRWRSQHFALVVANLAEQAHDPVVVHALDAPARLPAADLPGNPEAIDDLAVARRKKSRLKRHPHRAAFGELGEEPFGLGLVGRAQAEIEARRRAGS